MALSTALPLARLKVVLEALPGMQAVTVGAPAAPGNTVTAYIALAGQRMPDQVTELMVRHADYFVGFAYRVAGAVATAETTVAALLDAFLAALLTERATGLAGTCDSLAWDFTLAGSPEYQVALGREFRVYPVVVTVTQHLTH